MEKKIRNSMSFLFGCTAMTKGIYTLKFIKCFPIVGIPLPPHNNQQCPFGKLMTVHFIFASIGSVSDSTKNPEWNAANPNSVVLRTGEQKPDPNWISEPKKGVLAVISNF